MHFYNYPYSYYQPYYFQYHGHQYVDPSTRVEGKYQRGKVSKMVYEIEYPDGTKKVMMLENTHDVTHVVFDQNYLLPGDSYLFNVSVQDWKQNPAMIVYRSTGQATPQYYTVSPTTGLPITLDPIDPITRPRPRPLCSSIRCGLGLDPDIKILPPDIFQDGGPFDV